MKYVNSESSIKRLMLSLSVVAILLLTMGGALAWDAENVMVTPNVTCVNGENITISGDVGPGDYVPINVFYTTKVPVVDGAYYYNATPVQIPPGSISSSIMAEEVNDMTIATKFFVLPLTKTFGANADGFATATSPIWEGTYPLIVSGNSIQDNVNITFVLRMEVQADENGHFVQVAETNRPAGNYTLEVGRNKVKENVTLIDCNSTTLYSTEGSSSSENNNGSSIGTEEAVLVMPPLNNTTVNNSSVAPQTVITPLNNTTVNNSSVAPQTNFIVDAIMNMFYFVINIAK